MSTDAAKAVVRRNTEEVQGRGNFDVFDELFAVDFVDHTPQPGFTLDRDGARSLYRARYRISSASLTQQPTLPLRPAVPGGHRAATAPVRHTRRVERAKQLLQGGSDLSLAEVAVRAGFSDQSVFSHHFKRLVGVTPGRFRTPARFAYHAARSSKKSAGDPLTIPHEQSGSAWSRR